jgi:hypothetical protein
MFTIQAQITVLLLLLLLLLLLRREKPTDYHASKYLREAGQFWLLQQQSLRNAEEVVLNSYVSLPPPSSSAHSCALPGLAVELRGAGCAAPPPPNQAVRESLCKFLNPARGPNYVKVRIRIFF